MLPTIIKYSLPPTVSASSTENEKSLVINQGDNDCKNSDLLFLEDRDTKAIIPQVNTALIPTALPRY